MGWLTDWLRTEEQIDRDRDKTLQAVKDQQRALSGKYESWWKFWDWEG